MSFLHVTGSLIEYFNSVRKTDFIDPKTNLFINVKAR